jgi:hypothetical protein
MTSARGHIPDYLLEQYALGELPPGQMAELHEMVSTDSSLATRLDALHASNRAILHRHPPDEFAKLVKLRHRIDAVASDEHARQRSKHRRFLITAPAFAAALILVVILSQSHEPTDGRTRSIHGMEYTREKGLEPHLKIFRKVDDDAELLTSDSMARNGDVLQIAYVAHGSPFGVIISIDGRGVVTLHYPDGPTCSTRLEQDGEIHVPHAYEIDDAPNFERFFFITGTFPIEVGSILAAAKRLAGDPTQAAIDTFALGDGFKQSTMLIRKQEVNK